MSLHLDTHIILIPSQPILLDYFSVVFLAEKQQMPTS